jgi:hypothetical protein
MPPGHLSLISHPDEIAQLILKAAAFRAGPQVSPIRFHLTRAQLLRNSPGVIFHEPVTIAVGLYGRPHVGFVSPLRPLDPPWPLR